MEMKRIRHLYLQREFMEYQIFGFAFTALWFYLLKPAIPNILLSMLVGNTIAFTCVKMFINKKGEKLSSRDG